MIDTPRIFLGTYQNTKYQILKAVVDVAFEANLKAFDTAPSYGTEGLLGKAILEYRDNHGIAREDFFVSDKIDAWQMQKYQGNVRGFVDSALYAMHLQYFDILFIHWPIEEYVNETWKCFRQLQDEGKIRAIGICNVRVRHLQAMAKQGIHPQFIQIERHPLRTCYEEIEYCQENGIKIIAYSPLCRMHKDIKNSEALREIATSHHKNIGQLILRWHIDTGCAPVFMSQNTERIKANMNIFDFELSKEEITEIDKLNRNYKIFLESWGCPGF